MPDHSAPDYQLEETLSIETVDQFKALFDETRMAIADLLLERAATTTELAGALDRPKGTIGHHVQVMEDSGLIQVVRTKKVRAVEAKYYGRTARTFLLTSKLDVDVEVSPDYFLTSAAVEFAKASTLEDPDAGLMLSTLRYARIPADRAREWVMRLSELSQEFVSEPRAGDTSYGMLLAFYPTARPTLPHTEEPS
jgi:DNA-binding transcriptional ArsR family regulator